MIYSILFGISGIFSFIYENNKLLNKYYNKTNNNFLLHKNYKSSEIILFDIPLNPFIKTKYNYQQKVHYFLTLIMVVVMTTIAFEAYFRGYTKLHLKHEKLVWLPLEVIFNHFINSTVFYYYHKLAHTKFFYKYIHSYHHAFLKIGRAHV